MKTMPKTALIAAVAGALLSGASHADPYVRDVAIQLMDMTSGEYVTFRHSGELRDGWYEDLDLVLEGGVAYRIQGACDRDCGDLDFELFDRYGRLVERDVAADDIPIILKMSNRPATYTLRVSMPECAANPCVYGVVAVAE